MARGGQTFEIAAANEQLALFERLLARSPDKAKKAALRALRRSVKSGASNASKEVRKEINLSKRAVDKRVRGKVVSQRGLIGSVSVRDRRIELIEFMTPGQISAAYRRMQARRGDGVAAKPYKKRPRVLYPGTFVQVGKKSGRWHVLKREGKDRYPVFIQYGPNLIEQYEKALPAFAEKQAEAMQKNLAHELNRVVESL